MSTHAYRNLTEYIDALSKNFTPPTGPSHDVIQVYRPKASSGSYASAFDRPSLEEATALAHRFNHQRKHYQGGEDILRIAILAPDGTFTDIYRYRGKK